jgi:putative ABC transport system substrate-binding protein
LRELGYVEGRDFIVEVVSAEGRGFFDPTSQLVRARVDVLLVSVCGAPLDAARRATRTIPIVVATCNDDLVETGAVVSLHRPGGNVTGFQS